MLDAQEYLHLAVNATQSGDHHAALSYLHQCLELAPDNANAHYLIGAEYAELGLIDRSIEAMEKALSLDSGILTARFQLGLLYLKTEQYEHAIQHWQTLNELKDNPGLATLAQGMIHLAKDEEALAVNYIERGIELNTLNPELNDTMQYILSLAKKGKEATAEKQNTSNAETETEENQDTSDSPLFLGAYKNSKLNDD
ncbi:MAG: hypothetical protein COA42_16900 [Alteromonadaceae bacterium]|nr:MAG: hypothetical protein COA42_16900 [Alteromonadaceae bacterium]